MLGDIKAWLSTQFSMKDMGEASYILGIKIYRDRSRRTLGLTQSSFIEKVLQRFRMEHSKRGLLPMRHGIKLSKKQSPKTDEELTRMSDIPYASAVGSIQYAVQCTRPDVTYALSITSRYQACAGEAHWSAVKSILKYLKRTQDILDLR
ncbi:UNVERIFIED_CONTAM: Retrovirus-related Pol polyprotein from transposon TNT 1-94 [Sesamum latifolium]|uniref:Retrovirus-related Pol polyprotein from transposon TNT 1-94 n=1 Tax=Sesamum latifolium TaxID=2727402 RepID=A0AAW2XNP7_9LAMI